MLVLASGCTKNLWIDYEPNIDFSTYNTFAWNEVKDAVGHQYYFQEQIDTVLKARINELMQAKGLRLVKGEQADLFLDFHYYVKENYFEQSYCPAGYYGGSGFSPEIMPGPRCDVEEKVLSYDSGNFALDLIDVKTGQLVWRGHSFEVVENPRFTSDILSKKVSRLLHKYPPKIAKNR